MSMLLVNGHPCTLGDPALPVLDRGYLYGEGLFETLRAYAGKLPFLDLHFKRFYQGAKFLGIKAPSRGTIKRQLAELLAYQKTPNAYIKLILSSQGNTIRLSKPQVTSATLCAYLETFTPYPRTLYQNGISATIVQSVRNDSPPLCWYKTTNYLSKVMARHEVEKKGVWEGILLNPAGHLSEGSISNLFWAVGNTVYTPSLAAGCLPGVTRYLFITSLRAAGIPCREVSALPAVLSNASEVMITNSLFEILPVVAIDGTPVGNGRPGPFFKKMTQLYRTRIRLALQDR